MKKSAATREQKKTEIEQLSQAELVEMVLGLQKIIEELQEKLAIATGKGRTTSKTSSKPPSTDLIQKPEKPTAQPESDQKKKPGGQPGHQGKTRKGFGRVDRTEISSPSICLNCGSQELSQVINTHSQQVATLVAKPIEVVEYQTQSCKCLECGAVVRGELPSGIVPGQDLSVNLQALLVWLGNYGHLSYAKQTELLWELGKIEVSVGTIQKTNQRVAAAVKPAIKALWEWAPLQSNVHVDETPWCVMGVKEWLWTASGEGFCLFHAADTRGRVELETMLGKEFAGVLSSDDFSVYNGVKVAAQQKCLAHLRRHFKKVLGLRGNNNNVEVAQIFLSLIDEAFRAHESWRKTKDRLTYDSWAQDFKIRLNKALDTWLNLVGYAAGLLLKSLRDKAEQWWYFLSDPSIPPDNNLAERSLRLAVTKRKVSGGSRSMKGFEETADLLSVIQTCRFQARSVMAFFREAISAHSCDLAMPELVPISQT
ncbi:IS66 family transposase [Microcoleus sp. herbarium12]|uniref:IS66 family transposase n=1 Tax=Microcoleus sp. herbarium12 TaxID=3055437 RepID=UPI002FD77B49